MNLRDIGEGSGPDLLRSLHSKEITPLSALHRRKLRAARAKSLALWDRRAEGQGQDPHPGHERQRLN